MKIENRPRLPPELARVLHGRHPLTHLGRFAIFAGLYFGGSAAAILLSQRMHPAWLYLSLAPFYLLAAASLHGISLFTHEAVHGTLSRNRLLNHLAGAVCAIPVLQNFAAYRILHLRHHDHLGEEEDPDHYANYTSWSWLVFIMNWLRLLLGYPVYIIAIPILAFRHASGKERLAVVAELLATILLAATLLRLLPGAWLLHGWLVPMLFINTMVNVRGMSQHTLLEHATDEIQGTRSILTRPLIRFFMCNENYHLEHHLYPGIPWHHLPEVHHALKGELELRGAPYIKSYSSFVREFIHGSLKRSPLSRRS